MRCRACRSTCERNNWAQYYDTGVAASIANESHVIPMIKQQPYDYLSMAWHTCSIPRTTASLMTFPRQPAACIHGERGGASQRAPALRHMIKIAGQF